MRKPLVLTGIAAILLVAGYFAFLRDTSEIWQEYKGENGGYTVSLPIVAGRMPRADCGINGQLDYCLFHTEYSHLGVVFWNARGMPYENLKEFSVNRDLTEYGGELIGKVDDVAIDGVRAIDYSIRSREEIHIRTRTFVYEGKVVEVKGVSRSASNIDAYRKEADRFVTSFKLDKNIAASGKR